MRKGDGLAILAGGLLVLAFAPFNYPILAIVALLILLLSWQKVSPSRAVWRGYLFGLAYFGMGLYWVYFGVRGLSGASALMSVGGVFMLVAYLAIYPAFIGWLMTVGDCDGTKVIRLLLIFPAAWVLLEWLRGWFLTGFPWLQVGYSQIDMPLAGVVPIAGVYGVSWLLALTTSAMLALYYLRAHRRWGLLGGMVCLWVGSEVLRSVYWTQPIGLPFQATLIQGNIPLQKKWLPEQREDTLQLYTAMTRQYWDSRLIVWPETALPVLYESLDPQFVRDLNEAARQHDSHILLGVIAATDQPSQYFNAAKLWGSQPGVYHKRHLVPFGEYLPLRSIAGLNRNLAGLTQMEFKSGAAKQLLLTLAGYRFSVSICYEDVFGQESLQGLPEATYLVNISDDGGWTHTLGVHQHFQMARFRALEAGRYLLRSTATGVTAFINDKGQVVRQLELFQRAALTSRVVPMMGSTPYTGWGDLLVLCVMLVSLGLGGLAMYQPKKI